MQVIFFTDLLKRVLDIKNKEKNTDKIIRKKNETAVKYFG